MENTALKDIGFKAVFLIIFNIYLLLCLGK